MKKQILIIILLLLNSIIVFMPSISTNDDWEIIGDSVILNTSNAYLSVTPHTIVEDTWVTFKLRSKNYEGDIDTCWLFNTTNCKPTNLVYYKIDEGDWQILNKEFVIENIDFENMTKAYLLEDINIQKDINYSLKCFVDITPHTSGKYWWGVKPSGLGWANGYYLDPWWGDYVDFTTFTEVDPQNRWTNTTTRYTVTGAQRDETNYVYKDYGVGYFGSYWHHNFTLKITSTTKDSIIMMHVMSDELGGYTALTNANAIYCYVSDANNHLWMRLNSNGGAASSYYVNNYHDGTKSYYMSMSRVGTDLTLKIFDDEQRNNLNTTLTTSVYGSYTSRYLYAGSTVTGSGVTCSMSGYIEYLGIIIGTSPTQSNEYPTNGSVNIPLLPTLNVTVNDSDLDTLNASWYSNSSGNWVQFGINSSINTVTGGVSISQTNANFSVVSTIYYWAVNVTDDCGNWTNATYHFTTTADLSVYINESTAIEETNATLHGYCDEGGTGNYNYGFLIGTTTPVTVENADINATGIGTITTDGDRNFSYNAIGLNEGTHYYIKSWFKNATYWTISADEENFWTKCNASSGFTAVFSGCNVDLLWTKGAGADTTIVVRKIDSYPTSRIDGTVIYNNTGTSYSDTTAMGSHQYYRAWSWAGDKYSDGNASANLSVPPCPPTDVGSNVLSNNTFNIFWTNGTGAATTVVRKKLISYPSSVTDGTEIYNGTGIQINIQDISGYYYYSLWSYANNTYSSSVNMTVGGLVINCFDEETNDSLWFDVFISNQDGSQTYESRNNTNPLILNISQLPTGDDIKIVVDAASNYSDKSETSYWGVDENYTITYIVLSQVPDSKSSTNVTCINTSNDHYSFPPFTLVDDLVTILPDDADNFTKVFVNYTHEEYSSRLYYRDIEASSFSILNTYLPPTEDKELYLLEVIDEADNVVKDAHIEVKRSINGTYVIVSRLLTDANGQADLYLISNRNYIFVISKDGYVTENASWTPGTSIFTHTFKITWEIIPPEYDKFGDIINFYGTLYINNTMMVSFYDLDDGMTDSHFIVYENYNGTLTYMGEYNGTTSNDITFWVNVTNATRLHIIILYMNHSTLGEVIDYRIIVYPVHVDRDEGNWLEDLIISVVGDFTYGYVVSFLWYLPCVLLIVGMAAIKHPGVGILGAGLYSIWITWYIDVPGEAKILAFASIAIVTGFITLVLVKGKDVIH